MLQVYSNVVDIDQFQHHHFKNLNEAHLRPYKALIIQNFINAINDMHSQALNNFTIVLRHLSSI